jgi:hypothetical protein
LQNNCQRQQVSPNGAQATLHRLHMVHRRCGGLETNRRRGATDSALFQYPSVVQPK